jgi:hypothetical protein
MKDSDTIYAASAVATEVWTFLEGLSDDGSNIATQYKQELKTGDLTTVKELLGMYVQGKLSQTSSLTIDFDIYDIDGVESANKATYTWTTSKTGAYPLEALAGGSKRIKNYTRLIMDITCTDKLEHEIVWATILTREKRQLRRRNLI